MTLRADALRNRERLLEVARDELAEGNLALQLNDIARKAGVGVGTAYRHFPTPQALLEEVVGGHLQQLIDIAKQALAMDDVQAGLTFMLRQTLDGLLCTDGLSAVVMAIEDADEVTTQAKEELQDITGELMRRAYEAKVVRSDISAEDVRNLMCGLEKAIRVWPDDGDQGRADRYLDVLLQGLR